MWGKFVRKRIACQWAIFTPEIMPYNGEVSGMHNCDVDASVPRQCRASLLNMVSSTRASCTECIKKNVFFWVAIGLKLQHLAMGSDDVLGRPCVCWHESTLNTAYYIVRKRACIHALFRIQEPLWRGRSSLHNINKVVKTHTELAKRWASVQCDVL